MKAELKKRPYVLIAILMMASIMYLGLAMRTFEMFIFVIPNFIKLDHILPMLKQVVLIFHIWLMQCG